MGKFDQEGQLDGELATERKKKTRKPRRFKVLLHNDDYTTTDFVVDILMRHFSKQHAEAVQIILQVHTKGVGTAGVYPRDVAETKILEVTSEARAQGMRLVLSKEPE